MKLKTMTVGELKELLENYHEDQPVAFSYPSGDHWHTELIGLIDSAETEVVKYSEYHRCFQIENEADEETQEILILGKGRG